MALALVLLALALLAGELNAQAPSDWQDHPAVREDLTIKTRLVMLELAVWEIQNLQQTHDQRLRDLEAAVGAIDVDHIDMMFAQLQTQDQVILQWLTVVETVPTGGEE
jgi:hypothetical protein